MNSQAVSSSQVIPRDTYSLYVGLAYIFNLIFGTGALAMPAVFAKAGYATGTVLMLILCFMSFLPITFVIEAMANSNFLARLDEAKEVANESKDKSDSKQESDKDEDKKQEESATELALKKMEPTKEFFEIDRKFELGQMCEIYLSKWVSITFVLVILIYMYGDLVIYNAIISKSLRQLACTAKHDCAFAANKYSDLGQCWPHVPLTRHDAYRIFMTLLILIFLPLTYLRFTKTKAIQVVTILLRWVAAICMVSVALKIIFSGEGTGEPELINLRGFPQMFGVCVYAFMCHHSLPAMITPIDKKKNLYKGIVVVFFLVLLCYFSITFSGIFAFGHLADVYTLNFSMNTCEKPGNETTSGANIPVINIFVPSYPVFTIFSSYTVIAFTTINNLSALLSLWVDPNANPMLANMLPMLSIIPPFIGTLFTENVSGAISIVGAYSGSLIQYVFPAVLAHYSRLAVLARIQPHLEEKLQLPKDTVSQVNTVQVYQALNLYKSPFQNRCWIIGTGIWWLFSVGVVTANYFIPENIGKKRSLLPNTDDWFMSSQYSWFY